MIFMGRTRYEKEILRTRYDKKEIVRTDVETSARRHQNEPAV